MKIMSIWIVVILTSALALRNAEQPSEVEQLKSALIGHTMGGREKGWKFQSVDQIKELVIQNKVEDAQRRTYSITLELQDPRVPGKCKAEARVVQEKVGTRWEIKSVGLISMVKIE
jgi:hypothetical protein